MRISDWSSDVCSSDLVVRADREAVKVFKEFVGEHGVARQLAHHDDLQAIVAALETVGGEDLVDLARLIHRAHERNHDLDVGQTHFFAYVFERLALEFEARTERLGNVARSEERRVGKEGVSTWRYRWSTNHEKTKQKRKEEKKHIRNEH